MQDWPRRVRMMWMVVSSDRGAPRRLISRERLLLQGPPGEYAEPRGPSGAQMHSMRGWRARGSVAKAAPKPRSFSRRPGDRASGGGPARAWQLSSSLSLSALARAALDHHARPSSRPRVRLGLARQKEATPRDRSFPFRRAHSEVRPRSREERASACDLPPSAARHLSPRKLPVSSAHTGLAQASPVGQQEAK